MYGWLKPTGEFIRTPDHQHFDELGIFPAYAVEAIRSTETRIEDRTFDFRQEDRQWHEYEYMYSDDQDRAEAMRETLGYLYGDGWLRIGSVTDIYNQTVLNIEGTTAAIERHKKAISGLREEFFNSHGKDPTLAYRYTDKPQE